MNVKIDKRMRLAKVKKKAYEKNKYKLQPHSVATYN